MAFSNGEIYEYNYLWHYQAHQGEETGHKPRPVCLLLPASDTSSQLLLFPITTVEPEPSQFAVEIPEIERRRVGLDRRNWLIADEYNLANTDELYDFGSVIPRGTFSLQFLRSFVAAYKDAKAAGAVKAIKRT